MAESPAAHLFVINDARALAWILSEKRLAFSHHLLRAVYTLLPGQAVLLYTTQQCFGGYTRKARSSRIIGEAVSTSPVKAMSEPYKVDGRTFPFGCTIDLVRIARREDAPEFGELVSHLHAFKGAWNLRLRSSLVPLDKHDYEVISRELDRKAVPPDDAMSDYVPFRPKPATRRPSR